MRREEPSERRALKVTRRLSVWGNVTDRRAKYPYCKRTAVVHEPIATFALAGPCFRPPPRRAPDTVSVMRNPGTRIEMRYTYLPSGLAPVYKSVAAASFYRYRYRFTAHIIFSMRGVRGNAREFSGAVQNVHRVFRVFMTRVQCGT